LNARQTADLLLLAALWGASFLLMRIGAPEFSAASFVFVRVAGAGLLLLPLLLWRGGGLALRQHWRPIFLVGVVNSALPFTMIMVAASVLSAGLMSIFNATTPIWGAFIAWWWLGERPDRSRVLGLVVGLVGVAGLAWGKADFKLSSAGISPALGVAACVLAPLAYGVAANYSRQRLAGVPPLAVATGSQLGAALVLALPAWWWWPVQQPSSQAWASAAVLAVACTALAYLLYFRLIAQVGAAKTMAVTFLIPAFAMGWGWLFLAEVPTGAMLLGGGAILAGTALATGVLRLPLGRPAGP
jgi:drug/metabolite transporter (DMT)-like permease